MRRVAPVTWISLPHSPFEDAYIPGTDLLVRKGAEVHPLIGLVGKDPKVFPDVDAWRPERYLPGGENADFGVAMGINPAVGDVVPFSMGGRRCVGRAGGGVPRSSPTERNGASGIATAIASAIASAISPAYPRPPACFNSCAGYRIGLAEVVLTVGNLFRCFDVELAGPLDLRPRMQFTWHPHEDIQLRFKPRAAAAALQTT